MITTMETCDRCDGDGKAHGSDRPFEYSGPGTYPGPCPKCKGTGKQEDTTIYCHECSIAGGADRPVYHEPPACEQTE